MGTRDMFVTKKTIERLERRLESMEGANVCRYEPQMRELALKCIRDHVQEVVDEELLGRFCTHDDEHKIILAVEDYLWKLDSAGFRGLIELCEDALGDFSIASAKTYYDLFDAIDGDGDDVECARVYVRRCKVCGSTGPVTAFDVAAAGNRIQVRDLRDFESISRAAAIDTASASASALDALLGR